MATRTKSRSSRRAPLTSVLALVLVGALVALVLGGKPPAAVSSQPDARAATGLIARPAPAWQQVVLMATRDVSVDRSRLIELIQDPRRWSEWGPSLYRAAEWSDPAQWVVGKPATFWFDLGLPLGVVRSAGTVRDVQPGKRIGWAASAPVAEMAQLWRLEPLADGGTHIVAVVVLEGAVPGMLRSLTERRWQTALDAAVDGLVLEAHRLGAKAKDPGAAAGD